MVCDFTPLHVERYYAELLSFLRPKGVILATYPAPELAMEDGKYQLVPRDGAQLAAEAARAIAPRLSKPRELLRTVS